MKRKKTILVGTLVMALGLFVAPTASAAELEEVSAWGPSGVPGDVSMHLYVPDQVVTNPPRLLLVHYCGGTADAVFGQARGGGIVSAADPTRLHHGRPEQQPVLGRRVRQDSHAGWWWRQRRDHQATRERWQSVCGNVVLDAFTSLGGDHGPSDALFAAEYVIPFLGLDQTGPLDPGVEACASGGAGGSGGAGSGSGGNSGGLGGASLGGTAMGGGDIYKDRARGASPRFTWRVFA